MTDSRPSVGEAVIGFVAALAGRDRADLAAAAGAGDEWLGVLRQWLAREEGCGLVSLADPSSFSWPGHWIGIVDDPASSARAVGVLLFGSPSAVIESPGAPELVGRGVEELAFRDALVIVPTDPFGRPAPDRRRTAGEIAGIYIADAKTEPMRSVTSAKAMRDRGLEGDRYAAKAGTFTPRSDRLRGYDLTLIEAEVLHAVALPDGTTLAPEESRRNIVTKGIDLNALVGHEFRIGAVRAFAQRLCEPCVHLQRLTRPGIVAALVHKGGIRADILTDGEIRVGDRIEAVAGPAHAPS